MFPIAVRVGCPENTFWNGPLERFWAYLEEYNEAEKDKEKLWKQRTNFEKWLEGYYVELAVGAALSKNVNYPKEPIDIYGDKPITRIKQQLATEEDPKKRNELTIQSEIERVKAELRKSKK